MARSGKEDTLGERGMNQRILFCGREMIVTVMNLRGTCSENCERKLKQKEAAFTRWHALHYLGPSRPILVQSLVGQSEEQIKNSTG